MAPWYVPYKAVHANTEEAAVSEVTLDQVLEVCRPLIQVLLAKRTVAAV